MIYSREGVGKKNYVLGTNSRLKTVSNPYLKFNIIPHRPAGSKSRVVWPEMSERQIGGGGGGGRRT